MLYSLPITAHWTPLDGSGCIQGYIYHLSFSRLKEEHHIFFHGYLVREVLGIDKLMDEPDHISVYRSGQVRSFAQIGHDCN